MLCFGGIGGVVGYQSKNVLCQLGLELCVLELPWMANFAAMMNKCTGYCHTPPTQAGIQDTPTKRMIPCLLNTFRPSALNQIAKSLVGKAHTEGEALTSNIGLMQRPVWLLGPANGSRIFWSE
jgi:hypothetical protein